MKRLKWIIPLAVVVLLAAAVLSFLAGKGISTGYCVVADNGSRLIVLGNSPVRLSNRCLSEDALYKFDTGDKLLVLHDGIQETYPGSTAAYFCIKIGEGSAKDIPEDVFVGLYELNWLSGAYLEAIGITPPKIEEDTSPEETISSDAPSYYFTTQYARTNAMGEVDDFPAVIVLNTFDELSAYIEDNRELFDLESEFIAAAARYDEGYFLRQNLVLIRLEEGSGSIRHELTDVRRNDLGRWQLSLDRVTPAEQTDDMAQWHILLEVQMGKVIQEEEGIDLVFDSYTPVSFSYGSYTMTLDIPEGWEFEEDADDYRQGLRFRPKVETDGWVALYYHSGGFGVCGTGLYEHGLRLTNGFKGHAGFYDGSDSWNYITIDGYDDYVFINDGASWLREYRDEVFGIVASVDPEMILT